MGSINNLYNICSPDDTQEKINKEKTSTLNLEIAIPNITKSTNIIQNKWRKLKSINMAKKLVNTLIKGFDSNKQIGDTISGETLKLKTNYKVSELEHKLDNFILTPNEKKKFLYTNERRPVLMKDGSIYIGSWDIYCNRHGFGKSINVDGSIYIGIWVRDVINMRGRILDLNGDYFEGNFLNGRANGKGTMIKENGTRYVGDWKDDMQEGDGEEIFTNGSKYRGQFSSGVKTGYGSFYWSDGSSYDGMFLNNSIHGKGVYKWADLRVYNGDWSQNQMHGYGVFTWQGGKKYEGNYINDKKEGYGVYYWSRHKYYDGQWLNGRRHGLGTLYLGKKIKKGIWTEGKLTKNFNKNDVIYELDEQKYVKENLKKSDNFFTDYNKMIKLQKKAVSTSPSPDRLKYNIK